MAKGKRKGGGSAVVRIKAKPWYSYMLIASGGLLAACVILGLFGMMFFALPEWARILLSLVFLIPAVLLSLMIGRGAGDRDFRIKCQELKPEDKDRRPVDNNPYLGIIYVLPFVGLMLILSIFANAFSWSTFQAVLMMAVMPVSLLFYGAGIIPTETKTQLNSEGVEEIIETIVYNWTGFAALAIFVILLAGGYALGYYLNARKLRAQQAKLITEIRSVRR